MTRKLKSILARLRSELGDLYGDRLVRVLLFGSQARADACQESDIDVLIVLTEPVRPGEEITRTGKISSRLSLENDVVISCVFVSEERLQNERTPFFLNVKREGLAV